MIGVRTPASVAKMEKPSNHLSTLRRGGVRISGRVVTDSCCMMLPSQFKKSGVVQHGRAVGDRKENAGTDPLWLIPTAHRRCPDAASVLLKKLEQIARLLHNSLFAVINPEDIVFQAHPNDPQSRGACVQQTRYIQISNGRFLRLLKDDGIGLERANVALGRGVFRAVPDDLDRRVVEERAD